ncbi:MAG: ribonuclease HII [Prevotellaceae bacterium]|jgi:ribonuclease HII|nr:ribonuclease HII [Prevotellaceae bacterium]
MLKPFFSPDKLEVGCDEAGRGCLAGAVFAAAVALPRDFYHPLLNDSKQVKAADREELREYIERHAKAWAVAQVSSSEIDELNILKASFLAMHRAVAQLKETPELLLVDGNRFAPYPGVPHRCIVKGDAEYACIAAASILAKTHRDALMAELDKEFPQYAWRENKGYPTAKHRAAIALHGSTPFHRKTFNLLGDEAGQAKLF